MLGLGGPVKEVNSIAKERKIPLIEDNCKLLGENCQ